MGDTDDLSETAGPVGRLSALHEPVADWLGSPIGAGHGPSPWGGT